MSSESDNVGITRTPPEIGGSWEDITMKYYQNIINFLYICDISIDTYLSIFNSINISIYVCIFCVVPIGIF